MVIAVFLNWEEVIANSENSLEKYNLYKHSCDRWSFSRNLSRLDGNTFFYQLKTERNLAEFDLPEQINQLWNRWSGNLSTKSLPFSTALASPLVIQRRFNLRLISQADYF